MNIDLQKILNNIPIGVFVLRLESRENKEFRNVFINQTNSDIVGMDFAPYVGKTLRESFPDAYKHGLPDVYLQCLDEQKPISIGDVQYGDERIERKTWHLEVIPIDETTVMLTTENISDLKKAKRDLDTKNGQLRIKNKELEQFVYIASHDLQEPLRTVQNMVSVLESDYIGDLDEYAKGVMKYMNDATDRMRSLITGLLDYSVIGKEHAESLVDCDKLLHGIKDDLNSLLTRTNSTLTIKELPVVKGHETELRLLFQNLLTNGLKFVKPGVPPEIVISAEKKEDNWAFSVQDNGIGIADEHREKIFIMFQRLVGRDKYKGTGIGLAHCQKIVQLHGGKIWVDSELGTGSTFHFTIPD